MGISRVRIVESDARPKSKNLNTEKVLVSKPPTEYLARRTLPDKAIHDMFKLNSMSELIIYYHAAIGFPTNNTWMKSIKAINCTSWLGLAAKKV